MNKFTLLSAGLAAMLVALLPATPAQALNGKSYVSSTGGGTACTRAAPCSSIMAAHDATASGGEINCLDSGASFGFDGVTISKSITIDCAGLAATNPNIIVSGAGIVVRIRNLSINGFNGLGVVGTGIDFLNGAALFVENCLISNFSVVSPAIGIRFHPSAPGAQLVVTDTVLGNNGTGSTGGGIVVNPTGSGSAVVSLDRVTVADNVFGIVADGSSSTAGIAMVVKSSDVHRNSQDGIVATTSGGGAPIGLLVDNTASVSNNIGIRGTGPGVTVRADKAKVMHNGTGLVVNNGASLLSTGTNLVTANGVNGAFSGTVGLQ